MGGRGETPTGRGSKAPLPTELGRLRGRKIIPLQEAARNAWLHVDGSDTYLVFRGHMDAEDKTGLSGRDVDEPSRLFRAALRREGFEILTAPLVRDIR